MPVEQQSLFRTKKTYKIPTKEEYQKKRVDLSKEWEEVYGDKQCTKCHQNFQPGDEYEHVGNIPGEYRHSGKCPEVKKEMTNDEV